jgi:hypothetical protein
MSRAPTVSANASVSAGILISISTPTAFAGASITTAGASGLVFEVRISLKLEVRRRSALRNIRLQKIGNFLVRLDESPSEHGSNRFVSIGIE